MLHVADPITSALGFCLIPLNPGLGPFTRRVELDSHVGSMNSSS